ncbi:LRRC72 [Symbiodinium sp. CCMP2592]|nr:LRRC72 [Symbiodinium sp. CCMP2592]
MGHLVRALPRSLTFQMPPLRRGPCLLLNRGSHVQIYAGGMLQPKLTRPSTSSVVINLQSCTPCVSWLCGAILQREWHLRFGSFGHRLRLVECGKGLVQGKGRFRLQRPGVDGPPSVERLDQTLPQQVHLANKGAESISKKFEHFSAHPRQSAWKLHGFAGSRLVESLALRGSGRWIGRESGLVQRFAKLVPARVVHVLLASGNQLRNLDKQLALLSRFPFLKKLELFDNPVAEEPDYRLRLIYHVPQVELLDQHTVKLPERLRADEVVPNLDKVSAAKVEKPRPKGHQFSVLERIGLWVYARYSLFVLHPPIGLGWTKRHRCCGMIVHQTASWEITWQQEARRQPSKLASRSQLPCPCPHPPFPVLPQDRAQTQKKNSQESICKSFD